MTQQEFDFDMATLNFCISHIIPKRKKTVFRGLLFAAANEPRLVDAIDAQGFVLMTASIDKIAAWANVTPRAIQINVDRVRAQEPGILEQSATVNTAAEWMFNINSVLPNSAVHWFIDLVENVKSSPRTFEKFTPNFCAARGELPTEVHPKVRGELFNRTSMSLVPIKSKLARLASCCEKFAIAMSCSGDSWNELTIDSGGLLIPAIVDELFELAVESDIVTRSETTRSRMFTIAAIASRKEVAWPYFVKVLINGWLLTTIPSTADSATGRKLRRQADELRKSATAAQAVPAIAETPPTFDRERADAKLAETDFGKRVLKRRLITLRTAVAAPDD